MPTRVLQYETVKKSPRFLEFLNNEAARLNTSPEKTILVVDEDDSGNPLKISAEERPGPISSLVMGATTGVAPSIAGAFMGTAAGAAGSAAASPLVGVPAGLAAGVGTAVSVSEAQDAVMKRLMPGTFRRQEIRRQVWPKLSLTGNIASGAAGQRNLALHALKKLPALRDGPKAFTTALAADEVIQGVAPEGKALGRSLAINLGAGAGVGAGQDAIMQIANRPEESFTDKVKNIQLDELGLSALGGMAVGGGRLRFGENKALAPARRIMQSRQLTESLSKPSLYFDKMPRWDVYKTLAAAADDPAMNTKLPDMLADADLRYGTGKDIAEIKKMAEAIKNRDAAIASKDEPEVVVTGEKPTYDQDFVNWMSSKTGGNRGRVVKRQDGSTIWERFNEKQAREFAQIPSPELDKALDEYNTYKQAEEAKAAKKSKAVKPITVKPTETSAIIPDAAEIKPSTETNVAPPIDEDTPPVLKGASKIQQHLDKLDAGSRTNLDYQLIADELDLLPVRLNFKDEAESIAYHNELQKRLNKVASQSGLKFDELLAKDDKSILTLGPAKLGRTVEEALDYGQRLASSLAKSIKNNPVLQGDVDAIVAANKLESSKPLPLTLDEGPPPADIATGKVPMKPEESQTSVIDTPIAEPSPAGKPVKVKRTRSKKLKAPPIKILTDEEARAEIAAEEAAKAVAAATEQAEKAAKVAAEQVKQSEKTATAERAAADNPIIKAAMERHALGKAWEAFSAWNKAIDDDLDNSVVGPLSAEMKNWAERAYRAAGKESASDLLAEMQDLVSDHPGISVENAIAKLIPRIPKSTSPAGKLIKPKGLQVKGSPGNQSQAGSTIIPQEMAKAGMEFVGRTLNRIGKAFESGRTAEDRPEFIRSSVIDVLRPSVLKMSVNKEGRYDGNELFGRLSNTLHPVEKQILLNRGLEDYLKNTKRTPSEVAAWLEQHGPQVTVKKLFVPAERTKINTRVNQLEHELETFDRGWEGKHLDQFQFPPHIEDKIKELHYLRGNESGIYSSNDVSATARFAMVNPKPLEEMPNAVDILVALPENSKVRFQSGHYKTLGKNLLAHVRGYVETSPDGKKIFNIFEVRSDWANDLRHNSDKPKEHKPLSPPLLKDYNRLALKAAIEHAYREGLDGIAISDAETAMLTEGHLKTVESFEKATPIEPNEIMKLDIVPTLWKDVKPDDSALIHVFGNDWEEGKYIRIRHTNFDGFIARTDRPSVIGNMWLDKNELAKPNYGKYGGGTSAIEQEGGMRFNYDPNPATAGRNGKSGVLHELAAELTKYPGERVDFGEHQNAKENIEAPLKVAFKNPDGTLKTHQTAVYYPLDKVAAKLDSSPFAVIGKGPRGQELYLTPQPPNWARTGAKKVGSTLGELEHATKEAIAGVIGKPLNKLYDLSVPMGEGEKLEARQGASGSYVRHIVYPIFARQLNKLQNIIMEPLYKAAAMRLSSKQWEKIGAYAYDMDEFHMSPIKLTPQEDAAYQHIRASFDSSRLQQINDGQYINGKPPVHSADFAPHTVLAKDIRELLTHPHKNPSEANRYQEMYRNWMKSQDDKITDEAITATLETLLGKSPFTGKLNPKFNPLETAEGLGLPPAMREQNLLSVAKFYGIRSAQGLAWYRAVQKDPIAARIFGETSDGRGGEYVDPTADITPTTPNADQYLIHDFAPAPEFARSLTGDKHLEAYRADMSLGKHQHYDWIDNATAIVNAFKLGPYTTLRDITASSVGAMGELLKPSEIPYASKAMREVLFGTTQAGKAGGIRTKYTGEFAIDASARNLMGKIADIPRKYQGRDLGEKGLREFLWELGREVTKHRLAEGDTKALEFLGSKQWKRLQQRLGQEEFLDHAATKFMETMQGNYGPEYLHRALLKSSPASYTKAIFSLSRFSIERARRYRETVLMPLAEGNALPLLKSTAVYLGLAGPAAAAFIDLLSDRKPKNTTWLELLNLAKDGKPDLKLMDEFAYDFLANAAMTGMGGIVSGALYNAQQIRHGEKAMLYSNPAAGAIKDLGKRIVDYWTVYHGKDFFYNIWRLPYETIMQETQGLREARRLLDKTPDTGLREEQIMNRLTGKTKPSLVGMPTANPFSPLTKMKRATTAADIIEQEEGLEKVYKAYPPERPSRFTDPVRDPEYYEFLRQMQGQQQAGKAFSRDFQRRSLNPVRSMVANRAFQRARAGGFRDRQEQLDDN